jgi:hypothetical protein
VPNLLRNVGHTLAALTANCGDFHRAWELAAHDPSRGERWTGEWRSQTNGHHGELLCLLRRLSSGGFEAMFHARYAKYLRVCYTAPLKAVPQNEGFRLEGEADIGSLAGGVYTYRGELVGDKLTCAYECRYDRGVFELTRG